MTVHTLLRAMIGKLACSAIGGKGGVLALEGALDQGYVHPAVEFVGGVFDGAHHFEAVAGVQGQACSVVGPDGRDDRLLAGALRLPDQLRQEGVGRAPAVGARGPADRSLPRLQTSLVSPK